MNETNLKIFIGLAGPAIDSRLSICVDLKVSKDWRKIGEPNPREANIEVTISTLTNSAINPEHMCNNACRNEGTISPLRQDPTVIRMGFTVRGGIWHCVHH